MVRRDLEMTLLRAFVTVCDQATFTAAGERLHATQSTISARIKKLEMHLGRQLLRRSPQSVALTPFGERFLNDARQLLAAHDECLRTAMEAAQVITFELGVTDHAAGADLLAVLTALRNNCPTVQFRVTISASVELFDQFLNGEFDAVLMRSDEGDGRGVRVFRDQLVWCTAQGYRWDQDGELPLISLAEPCVVRSIAISALRSNSIHWFDTFLGSGLAAVQAATSAGFGVACLDKRNVPSDCAVVSARRGLPVLPATEISLHHRTGNQATDDITKHVASAFRKGAKQH